MKLYSIREMATEFGLTLRALRFYEGRGLISPTRSNYGSERVYSEADRDRLRKITTWTRYEFTLSEIKAALDSGGFPRAKLKEQIAHLEHKRAAMWDAISELEEQIAA